VLSHPLIVQAIESEFVPCCIYNNKKGKDKQILQRYKEPAWNNPVVRFVNTGGRDVIPRQDGVWSLDGIAARMVKALDAGYTKGKGKGTGKSKSKSKSTGKSTHGSPLYLRLLAIETRSKGKQKATFAMHCFWEGEAHLGSLPGVTGTRAGWLDRKEVVEVEYDESRISYEELVSKAKELRCASTVFAHDQKQLKKAKKLVGKNVVLTAEYARDAKLSDRLYHLRKSPLNSVPATRIQRVRMNSALAKRQDPLQFLSPHQREVAKLVQKAGFKKVEGMEPPPDSYYLDAYEVKLRKLIARAAR
jgi:hypothetical protein